MQGTLRLADFTRAGVASETVARLVRDGSVLRLARGLYQKDDPTNIGAHHVLVEAAVLVPKGVVCLISALQFHQLTLQMSSSVWMAIERGTWKPKVEYPSIRFVRFSGASMFEGIEIHKIEGIGVPIFDPAKTIVDCFRYRNKIGLDTALEGLREGLRLQRCTPDQLWRYARAARIWSVMRPYVEAMASDGA